MGLGSEFTQPAYQKPSDVVHPSIDDERSRTLDEVNTVLRDSLNIKIEGESPLCKKIESQFNGCPLTVWAVNGVFLRDHPLLTKILRNARRSYGRWGDPLPLEWNDRFDGSSTATHCIGVVGTHGSSEIDLASLTEESIDKDIRRFLCCTFIRFDLQNPEEHAEDMRMWSVIEKSMTQRTQPVSLDEVLHGLNQDRAQKFPRYYSQLTRICSLHNDKIPETEKRERVPNALLFALMWILATAGSTDPVLATIRLDLQSEALSDKNKRGERIFPQFTRIEQFLQQAGLVNPEVVFDKGVLENRELVMRYLGYFGRKGSVQSILQDALKKGVLTFEDHIYPLVIKSGIPHQHLDDRNALLNYLSQPLEMWRVLPLLDSNNVALREFQSAFLEKIQIEPFCTLTNTAPMQKRVLDIIKRIVAENKNAN